MVLPASITESLKNAMLIALNINDKEVIKEETETKVSDVLSKHSGPKGSICFVVRRPG